MFVSLVQSLLPEDLTFQSIYGINDLSVIPYLSGYKTVFFCSYRMTSNN